MAIRAWRITPVSKWLVTSIYKPFRPCGRGTAPVSGLTITMVNNHVLHGMILQVKGVERRLISNCSNGGKFAGKWQIPGDSSRDLFIPWRSRLQPLSLGHVFIHRAPKKSQNSQNCQVDNFLYFLSLFFQ